MFQRKSLIVLIKIKREVINVRVKVLRNVKIKIDTQNWYSPCQPAIENELHLWWNYGRVHSYRGASYAVRRGSFYALCGLINPCRTFLDKYCDNVIGSRSLGGPCELLSCGMFRMHVLWALAIRYVCFLRVIGTTWKF